MDVQQTAANFVAGEYSDLNGIGLHDAIHVLATRFQLSKPELRKAVQDLYATHEEPSAGTYNAACEGDDA